MKVIDLLNKIANNEIKDNTKFKMKNMNGFYSEKTQRIYLNSFGTIDLMRYSGLSILNEEIEIIEDNSFKTKYNCSELDFEIIKYINKLNERLNKLESEKVNETK